jgi:hypothetical protein
MRCRARVFIEQGFGGEHDARRAEAALRAAMLDQRLLDRMELSALGHALNGQNVPAWGFLRQHEAGVDRSAVHKDRAGTAVAVAASLLGAGQAQALAQQLQERVARVGEHGVLIAVHPACDEHLHDCCRSTSSAEQQSARARAVSTAIRERR